MATLTIFKSHIPQVNYVFKNGKQAIFQKGRYLTDVPWEIKELMEEIEAHHPHIYQDVEEKTIESEMLDPMVALKERFREEILAEERAKLAAAVNPERDLGTSEAEKLKPASSADVAAAMMGGSGSDLAAKLVNLKIGSAAESK